MAAIRLINLGIKWRIFLPARTNPVLRWSGNVFLIIGLMALSYVGFALLDARLYQAEQSRRFERALKETNLARAESDGSRRYRLPIQFYRFRAQEVHRSRAQDSRMKRR
jgi:hypothetical protein